MTDEFDDLADDVVANLIAEARWRSFESDTPAEGWADVSDPELFEALADYVDFLRVELRRERQRAEEAIEAAADLVHPDSEFVYRIRAERDALRIAINETRSILVAGSIPLGMTEAQFFKRLVADAFRHLSRATENTI